MDLTLSDTLVAHAGGPVAVAPTAVDSFARPDGGLDNPGWTDWAVTYPDRLVSPSIATENLRGTGTEEAMTHNGNSLHVRRHQLSRPLGTTRTKVTIELDISTVQRFIHQVGPAWGHSATHLTPALTVWYDYTFGLYWYGTSTVRHKHGHGSDDHALRLIDANYDWAPDGADRTVLRLWLAVADGYAEGGWADLDGNEHRMWGPAPIPDDWGFAADQWGIDGISIRLDGDPVDPWMIRRWWAERLPGPLGPYPRATDRVGPVASATTDALSIPLPATQTDDYLHLIVANGATGDLSTPAGWTRRQGRSGDVELCVFERRADGTETDAVVVSRTGAAPLAGVCVAARGAHPSVGTLSGGAKANASSTTVTAPSVMSQVGVGKPVYWSAASTGRITAPPAPDGGTVRTLAAHADDVALTVARIDTPLYQGLASARPYYQLDGTMATASPSVVITYMQYPDPR